jgi:D-serine deaminase-like pyridoxal phosphate-dependent protein
MNHTYLVGLPESMIPTPALVLNAPVFEKNMEEMRKYLAQRSVHIRPHAKTHKCPMIGHLQMKMGAIGLCCATVGEAEAMSYSGLDHILITSQIVGEDKIRRVAGLARHTDVIAAIDSSENLQQLSKAADSSGVTLGVLLEVDVGMGRCGTRAIADALRLAREAVKTKGVFFRGVMGYEGHAVFIEERAARSNTGEAANSLLVETARAIRDAGIQVEIVSAAGTGTFDIAGGFSGITELQAGSYVFMDLTYKKLDIPFDYALTVLAAVISRPTKDTVVLDCGMKSISVERELPRELEGQGLEILKLSEEHAKGHVSESDRNYQPGKKVHLIPSHCCTTVNLYDYIHVVRNGRVEAVWPIAARGAH